ncbi:hypothetical protein GCK72_001125 [Caenorhabditis remanei]|uniref:DUF38 domain-containing protein n=1 Tax=Caenorhabditis remanei TaxID=31234 RepID=A0A6A5HN26_CAERE|nr:hypothetical protein GCK72_001125 [Caenorhabditis remanei]KAF1769308.1 hypothetical protein GCK72_001125 [Caenorhabditis remanei]
MYQKIFTCNLKLCSRDDKALVDSTRYVPDVISIGEEPGRTGENSTIYLRYESLILTVTERNGITKVSTNSSIEYNTIKSRYDVARLWVEKIKNRGKIVANRIKILNFSMTPPDDWILKCDHLEIRMVPSQNLSSWLQKTIPKLKTLDVQMWKIDKIFGMDQVKNTSEMLKLSRNVSITDGELETILAPSIAIVSDGKITGNGAKKAFRKYVENSRPGDRFELRLPIFSNFDHRDLFDNKWIREEVLTEDVTMGEYM